jgi:gliding motility-associated-like protein
MKNGLIFKIIHINKELYRSFLLPLSAYIICTFYSSASKAQNCPPNINFETGTFNGWTCHVGYTSAVGDQNLISLSPSNGPVPGHHTMYSANNAGEVDPFGNFPVLCPNGSGHSIRLGSTEAGGQAEGISYEFTIPANENSYSLIYWYAVVFQEPNHRINEQPRMEIEVTNVTDNSIISCGSFSFIAVGTTLPGFQKSYQTDTTNVLYKSWSPVTVDLSGNAGKTIRLFFKTADCTFRRHFGYAYVDVDSDCSGSFVGAEYCPGDTIVHVTAPYGYASYTWYDSSLTTVLSKQQTIALRPPRVSGTAIAVKLDPYDGYGCKKTVFAYLKNTLVVTSDAGEDTLSCNRKQVSIGTAPRQGLVYLWTPTEGLNNPEISDPLAAPDKNTTYIVTTSSIGGGCVTKDSVVVKASEIDTSLTLTGKPAFCIGFGDSAILNIQPTQNIQWFRDGIPINGATETNYRVTTGGTYYALLNNADGCKAVTQKQAINIDKAKPGITYPVEYAVINLPLELKARKIGDTVLWNPGTNLDNPVSFTPAFKGVFEQFYTIEIKTNSGCVTVDTQLVKTVKSVEIYVPNAFTPNNDGVNDFLRPILRGIKEIGYFRVYNRQGKLLYETKSGNQGWDGLFKGLPQDNQAVVWTLECTGLDNVVYTKKGTSILLR